MMMIEDEGGEMTTTEDSDDRRHLEVGRRGEDMAVAYLREKGWRIEDRNFETKYGEIDIIAERSVDGESGRLVAFVEVKTRSSSGAAAPHLAVTADKRRKLVRMGRTYADWHGRSNTGYRFDVIGIDLSEDPPKLQHFEGAFDFRGRPY